MSHLHSSPLVAAVSAVVLGLVAQSAIANTYSSEDFEAGTPAYVINGIDGTGAGQTWVLLTASTAASVAGTDYDAGATSRVGIVANGNPTDIVAPNEPTGQHAIISTSANRTLTSNYSMPLASDNVQSLDISFSYMFYALNDRAALGSAVISYSAAGDFTDTVQLTSFGIGQSGSTVETPDHVAPSEEAWYTLDLSFTEAGAGITFTDTAKIRFNRVPLVNMVTPDATTQQIVFLDDIQVTGVIPEPASLAAVGLAGLIGLQRRRRNT